MGYTGGDELAPSYESVCSRRNTHTEALRLEFDPSVVSFAELMRLFVDDPRIRTFRGVPSGYAPAQQRKAVWAQTEEQAKWAKKILGEAGKPVPVLPACTFWEAEEYHQHHIADSKSYPDSGEDDPWTASDGPGTAWGL